MPHWQGIKRAFGPNATSALPPPLEELTYILRVDGSLGSFGSDGLDNLDLNLRRRYVSIDICIPTARWVGKSQLEVAEFIADCILGSADIIADALAKKKLACDAAALRADLKRGCDRFLSLFRQPD
ncbi:MAG: hypothetical protein U0637_06340 [Phycisphaerales bacterium]